MFLQSSPYKKSVSVQQWFQINFNFKENFLTSFQNNFFPLLKIIWNFKSRIRRWFRMRIKRWSFNLRVGFLIKIKGALQFSCFYSFSNSFIKHEADAEWQNEFYPQDTSLFSIHNTLHKQVRITTFFKIFTWVGELWFCCNHPSKRSDFTGLVLTFTEGKSEGHQQPTWTH